MKKLVFIAFILMSLNASAQWLTYDPIETPPLKISGFESPNRAGLSYSRVNTILDNGWHEADVIYYNPRTKTKSTYTLNVKSHNDRIIAISFGNGESVHTGVNYNNYTYSGGDLTFYKNKRGQIVSADTTVKIFRNGSYTYYKLEL